MKQIQKNKKEIGKEIEVLIRSIKLHYDNIAEEVRIPSIELELITAKIRKLHEKSIIFNHLHFMEEQRARIEMLEMDLQNEDDETPEENFIINANEISTPLVAPKLKETVSVPDIVTESQPEIVKEPVKIELESPKQELPIAEKVIEVIEQPKLEVPIILEPVVENIAPPIQEKATPSSQEIVGKDLIKIISFNDKYFLKAQLFANNNDEFNAAISKLNTQQNANDANNFIAQLKQQKSWNEGNEAYETLKRYITNKFM